jgi:hypothetical protein
VTSSACWCRRGSRSVGVVLWAINDARGRGTVSAAAGGGPDAGRVNLRDRESRDIEIEFGGPVCLAILQRPVAIEPCRSKAGVCGGRLNRRRNINTLMMLGLPTVCRA